MADKKKQVFTEEQRAIRNERSRLWRKARANDPEYKEYISKKCKGWREKNRDRQLAYAKQYREENKEKENARKRNRRRAQEAAEGFHTAEDIGNLFAAQKGKCAYCKEKLSTVLHNKYHVDHIMPISLGGSHWPSNLQLLCKTCNLKKHAKHTIEWAQSIGLLL